MYMTHAMDGKPQAMTVITHCILDLLSLIIFISTRSYKLIFMYKLPDVSRTLECINGLQLHYITGHIMALSGFY